MPTSKETQKLYRVTLRGLGGGFSIATDYKNSYVIATDPTSAYEKVRKFLNKKDLGFSKDRELESIELVAEETEYPDCLTILFS